MATKPQKKSIEKKPFDNKSFKTSLGLGEQTVKEKELTEEELMEYLDKKGEEVA